MYSYKKNTRFKKYFTVFIHVLFIIVIIIIIVRSKNFVLENIYCQKYQVASLCV